MVNICWGRLYAQCPKEGIHEWKEKTFCSEHYYEIYYGKIIRRFMDNMKEKELFKEQNEMYLHNRLLDCLKEAGFTGLE